MDLLLPTSSVPGILQARILEWVAISLSRGFSWPRNRTQVSCIAGRFFYQLSYERSLEPKGYCEGELSKKMETGASLVVRWLRIRLAMQRIQVQSLFWEDPTCSRPTKHMPQLLNQSSRAQEPQILSSHVATSEASVHRAQALQQEKPLQWERSPCTATKSSCHSPRPEKACV